MNKKEYAAYRKRYAAGTKGLDYISTGFCPSCYECRDGITLDCPDCKGTGLSGDSNENDGFPDDCPRCDGTGEADNAAWEDAWSAGEIEDSGHFSRNSCDVCGSRLGGDRYAMHGRTKTGDLLHLDVCEDCLFYEAHGELETA